MPSRGSSTPVLAPSRLYTFSQLLRPTPYTLPCALHPPDTTPRARLLRSTLPARSRRRELLLFAFKLYAFFPPPPFTLLYTPSALHPPHPTEHHPWPGLLQSRCSQLPTPAPYALHPAPRYSHPRGCSLSSRQTWQTAAAPAAYTPPPSRPLFQVPVRSPLSPSLHPLRHHPQTMNPEP